nr:polyketide synthase [Catenulispora pinistramenti]
MTDEEKLRDYLKQVTAKLRQTRQRLREEKERAAEPIAIVSMGCRYPGGVRSPEDLWQLLSAGGDAIVPFPTDRGWDVEGLFDPDPDKPGTSYVASGGFLQGVADFDPAFFGISPREALAMDPQQRLLLEVSWEALERAGIAPASLRGSATGVFAGAFASGYGADLAGTASEGYLMTGVSTSVLSGRVSYTLGLEGPAVTIDTACSSSLVAMHLACRALRIGECDLALAGGTTVLSTPAVFVGFSRQRGVSADGRCRSFSADADGSGWAEGAGVVVLERLSDARRNGHQVLAVVAGSALNQDGASNGLTAPNGPSQQRVIQAALQNAGVAPDDVDAVEAHGSATTLGDPIEAQALLATYGRRRSAERPLWLGAVKSNIGHSQCAAGVAGIIKMVLALQNEELPRTLHSEQPSHLIDWSAGNVKLLTEARPWPAGEKPRRAGVSSFGISGTNAHIILADPPAPSAAEPDEDPENPGSASLAASEPIDDRPAVLAAPSPVWVVSGRSETALRAQAGRLREFALARPELDPRDVGYSLAATRSVFEHRAVVLGSYAESLAVVATGQAADAVVSGVVSDAGAGRSVFVFPGQGAQFAGMGRELLSSSPVFAARMAECAEALAPLVSWSLLDVVAGTDGAPSLDAAEVFQPVLWAILVSLAALWQAAGVVPDAVIGHSQGEIAAATVAGALSLEDAARVVVVRSRALSSLNAAGAMVSVVMPEDRVRELIAGREGLAVAAVNSPAATVVSGDPESVDAFEAELAKQRVLRWRLPVVDYVAHSAGADALESVLAEGLAGIEPQAARIPMLSTVTGSWIEGTELTGGYWFANVRDTVRFADAVRTLAGNGYRNFIEVSPQPVLTTAVSETAEDAGYDLDLVTGTVEREDPGAERLIRAFAAAFAAGVGVDWSAVVPGRPVGLPTYVFQRQRFWPEPNQASALAARPGVGPAETVDARFWAAVERGDLAALADTLDVGDRDRLGEVVPALAAWRRRERDRAATEAWRYRIDWKLLTDPASSTLSGTWLLVTPTDVRPDLVAATGEALAARGAQVASVVVDVLGDAGTDRVVLGALIEAALGDRSEAIAGVVSLLALDERALPSRQDVPAGLAGTLGLVQALGDAGVQAPLWVLTSGAVATGANDPQTSPVQAQVWGLGRVAALEHPERWGGLVDLPAVLDDRAAARLCGVLAATDTGSGTEDQVAIRATGVSARRLTRAAERRGGTGSWTPRGTVLVTGGTGAVAGHVAGWLAERGAPRIVLTGRTGPAAAGVARSAALLASQGSAVEVVSCDVADRARTAGLLDRLAAGDSPLNAVIHTAGVVQSTALADSTTEELACALRAKAVGATVLDELTAGLDLDAFVVFSSIAATWGSGTQAGYSAANAHLDALVQDRRSRGLAATSLAWGPWGGGGMTEGEGARYLERRGLRLMEPATLVRLLGEALDAGEDLLTVADVDWAKFAPAFSLRRVSTLIGDLPEVRSALAADADADADAERTGPAGALEPTGLGRRLAGLSRADQDRLLVDLVRTEAASVLGHTSTEAVPAGRAFSDLGFDSLTAVELRNRLNAETGLRLPATLLFDHPNPAAVADFLRTRLGGTPAADPVTPVPQPFGAAADDDPIVIVAMACRYPGGVRTPEDLWQLVDAGADTVAEFPRDRGWNIEEIYHPDPAHPGTSYVKAGGFAQGVADFDAAFYGISPREAMAMDPQQRLLLDTSWEAFERAGLDPVALRGTQTGVFVGASPSGYSASLGDLDGHMITGNAASVLSGRVSYALGLVGPAVTVDTACSSALVALHLAAQALRNGECALALAGGVWVTANPAVFIGFSQTQGLAPDGRCKAFSDSADGMGIGEGIGMLLLERLSDARRNGHEVLAVVRGSAINQDGASNGLTAPNGPSQQRVIRAALAAAGLSGDEVDAVEAHGTGTVLGDPIEAQALLATYGLDHGADRPLWLGSVKSNIGHSQAAAGVAGVIKMVMAIRNGVLPRTLHAQTPSSHVDWTAGNVRLLSEPVAWPAVDRPRRAGVSAFGMSGTNVHTIIEQAPAEEPAADPADLGVGGPAEPLVTGVTPWLVSSRTADGLRAQAARLARFLDAMDGMDNADGVDADPQDVGWSLATTRSLFEHRAIVLGADRTEALAGLDALAEGRGLPTVMTGVAGDVGKTVFVFPGQGAQWVGMGRELLVSCPAFAARMAECAAALAPLVSWSLLDVVNGLEGAPSLDAAEVVQPVLWAVMVSLAAVWETAGVIPDAVVGHSQGEIAAATVAGALSLSDAARVVVVRSRALSGLGSSGAMVSVVMGEERVRALMEPWGERLSVAAVNGPAATVVSGEPDAVAEFEAELAAQRMMRWRVPETDFVAHSAGVETLESALARDLADVVPDAGRVPFFSTALSRWVPGDELDAGYWFANVRNTVRFADAIRDLANEGFYSFIEVSPHPTLEGAVADVFEETGIAVTPVVSGTTHQDNSGAVQILSVMARAFGKGVAVDWAKVLGGGRRIALPTYAFQGRRLWPAPLTSQGSVLPTGADGSGLPAESEFWAAVEGGDLRVLADTLAVDGTRSFDEIVPALAAWRRRERERAAIDNWRYRVWWSPVADPQDVRLNGRWLIVAPETEAETAAETARALASHGAQTVVIDGDTDRAALVARITEAEAGTPVSGVVSLLALDETPLTDQPEVSRGLAGTLTLVQALGDIGADAPLWVLTRGAVATGAGEALANPVQAQAWGLGRVVALEHRDRWGGLIDLPAGLDDRAAKRLCAVLAGCEEDQVAVRGSGILARRLGHAPLARTVADEWSPRGSVLITGGTGALAGHLAGWLAGLGAPRVVLTSRSGPVATGVAGLAAQVAERGAAVAVLAADVGRREEVAGLLARIGADGPALSTILHTAGILDDGLLDGLDAARLASVLTAKATGAAHLHELTADQDLDAFVLFSSAAATLGGAGQGNYAAANAYLDALAEHRAAQGLAALSVAYGPWAGGGVAEANDAVRQRMRRGALPPMDPEPALKALGQALAEGDPLLAVMDVDWPQFAAAPSPFVRDLPEVVAAQQEQAATGTDAGPQTALDRGELAERLGGRPAAEQERALIDLIRTGVAIVLSHDSADAVDAERAFADLGFDSLTTLEMRQQVSRVTGLRLPATLLFDYPTPLVLARYLRTEMFGAAEAEPATVANPPAAPAGPAADSDADPIVIVAMSCRYPGDVRDPEGFWRLLSTGTDAVSDLPRDREWPLDLIYDADSTREGTSYVRGGGFVGAATDFDAAFFGISPREALAMDPQQRMLLEVSWEALERAGLDPRALRGSRTGVFVGGATSNYGVGLQAALQGTGGLEGHLMTGNATSVLSGRVSYVLGLEGPAVTVDTACSSSLVTIHLAAQALRGGECALALAGGVTIMATPGDLVSFSRQRGLAPDGRSKAFSATADGMGMAEGVGMVVLERLSDARRNGHQVLAVVRGSAVNQDGASNGLTAPNGPSQQRVIRAALAGAGLSVADVDVVEAHGTGTELGDPIEAGALMATYGRDRPEDRPLWLGSVKSNIGHTQAAAGAAGVIKMVLALQNRTLPQTLHITEPSPHIDWDAGNVRLLTESVPWPASGRPRRAGVSSFGISGTNAHVILEEPPVAEDAQAAGAAGADPAGAAGAATEADPVGAAGLGTAAGLVVGGVVPWTVSGRSDSALCSQAERLRESTVARPELDVRDVAWSLASTRSVFEHRAVVVGSARLELAAGLAAVATGQTAGSVVAGSTSVSGRSVFVFPGQGAQWAGMGRELAQSSPVFADRLAECGRALAPFVDWSLDEVLADPAALEAVDVVQPALWAVMVSLAAVWQAAGVVPDAVVGHSQGEIAAATVAGALSLEDGARVVALRSRALRVLAGAGGMVSVAEPVEAVRARIAGFGDRLSIAVVNGPSATVVSGEPDALSELLAACEADEVRARRIPVDYASHSAQVEQLREEITAALAPITPGRLSIPMVSAVSGEWLQGPELAAGYWFDSLRATVEFDRAVRALADSGHEIFLEMSPHPVLTAPVTETLERAGAPDALVSGSLRRDDGGPERLLASFAEAWVRGVDVDWPAVVGASRRVPLPTYAFQSERFWPVPVPRRPDASSIGLDTTDHPLLAAAVELAAGGGLLVTGLLAPSLQPWLADHAVGGVVLLPGTAFVEMAVRAGDVAGCPRLEELTLETPLVLPAGNAGVQVQVRVADADAEGYRTLEIHSRPVDADELTGWTRHATGLLAPVVGPGTVEGLAAWPPADATPVPVDGFYERLTESGYGYGPVFQGLRAVWRRGAEVFAEVRLPEPAAAEAAAFGLHPALLDAVLHASMLAGPVVGEAGPGEILLPFAWQGVTLYASGAGALRVRLGVDAKGSGLTLAVADDSGLPVLSVESMVSLPVPAARLGAATGPTRDGLFSLDWTPVAEDAPAGRMVLVGPDRHRLAAAIPFTGTFPDLAALVAAIRDGAPVPDTVLAAVGSQTGGQSDHPADNPADNPADEAAAARRATADALALAQHWLTADELLSARLVLVTRGAVATGPGDFVGDLGGAALWGLIRSAQSENPDRLVLADLPNEGSDGVGTLLAALGSAEPELAVRAGIVLARRLSRPFGTLVPPADGPWRLAVLNRGTLDGLGLVEHPAALEPLGPGRIRVAVRAAGVNFRDVMATLDLLPLELDPDRGQLGSEVAGVVTEIGGAVTGIAVGDRVLGMATGAVGPVAVLDARLAAPVPAGLTHAQAAAVPVAYVTARYGLVDLAGARAGQRILIHAAAGGVGMAAVHLARHLGLEVFATASPAKWDALRALGLDDDHLASSRDAGFEEKFAVGTANQGMDIVLNALAGELTDASLRLLPRGGAFIEMGKTDIRDAEQVAADHPGVRYRAFSTAEAGPDRLGELLAEITSLLAAGSLTALPVRCWDVRRAPDALRFMSQARQIGKIVLTVPTTPRRDGTVLLTGGTGTLAALVAGHLAGSGRAGRLVLASRSGPAAPAVAALAARLADSGAAASVVSCDTADRDALAAVLAAVPADRPLTSVVHLAGVLDDGVVTSLTEDRVAAVMRPKADAAWHLHELTAGLDLDAFVMFSSAAAAFGGSGQGNYAAANAFLDGLAARRRSSGLAAVALDWGLWAQASALTGDLSAEQKSRMNRGGMTALDAAQGLALFDAALERDEALLVTALLDVPGMRARAGRGEPVPALWRGLAGGPARPAAGGAPVAADRSIVQQLGGMARAERDRMLLELVRAHVADVLGHSSREAVEPARAFKELGFDSLTAVELRNRLNAATGLRLPSTLVFDWPSSAAVAEYLRTLMFDDDDVVPADAPAPIFDELARLETSLAGLTADSRTRDDVTRRIQALLSRWLGDQGAQQAHEAVVDLGSATPDEVFDFLDREFGEN